MQAQCVGLVMTGRGDEAIAGLGFLSPSRIEPEPFEAELLTSRAQFKAWWGDLAGAQEDLSAVIRWSRAGVPHRGIPNAYGGLAEVEYRLGHWNSGLTYADAAVSLGEDSERLWDLPYVRAVASYLNAVRGNWSTARSTSMRRVVAPSSRRCRCASTTRARPALISPGCEPSGSRCCAPSRRSSSR